jgi:hypothetical protein
MQLMQQSTSAVQLFAVAEFASLPKMQLQQQPAVAPGQLASS